MRDGLFKRNIVTEGKFSNEDMEVVVASMQEAYRHTRNEFDIDPNMREKIDGFVVNFLLNYQVSSIVMPSSLDTLVREVFSNKLIRDFVLTLQFNFFSRWGEAAENFTSLTDNLSYGLGLSSEENSQFSVIPKQLSEALPSQDDVRLILKANKWLVVLLILKTAITVPTKQPS